jgi:NADH:ubiquinone oxidoreductase subunit K
MIILNDFFLLIIFLAFIGLALVFKSLINFILVGELIWISLYGYAVTGAIFFDSLNLFIWGIFLICLAACESTVGLSLLVHKSLIYGEQNLDNDYLLKLRGKFTNYLE